MSSILTIATLTIYVRLYMIDNFDHIIRILETKTITEDNFFFLQLLKRKKENPEMTSNNVTVDVFYINNAEGLLKLKDRIVKRCVDENARAYINLNMRSKRKVALTTMKLIAECIANDNYNVANIYTSAAGSSHNDPDRTWVVDIDMDETITEAYVYDLTMKIAELIEETGKQPRIDRIRTKNGFHLITQPFNVMEFKKTYPLIDVHKNNPTILYIP